jgi:hypothetical protein
VSVDAGPPIPPPQLSPDGKWVWDGNQWQPIADSSEPVHRGVFAAWNSIQVEPADPVAELAQRAPMQVQAPAPMPVKMTPPMQMEAPQPEIDYSYTVNDPNITPLWLQSTSSGMSRYLYFGAGLVVVVIVLMLLNSLNFVSIPFIGGTDQAAKPSPTPPQDTSGTDYVRADRFLASELSPPLSALEKTVPALNLHCGSTMTNSCFDAVTSTDEQVKNVVAAIKRGDVPKCIAAPMNKVQNDALEQDRQLAVALSGYQDNKPDELYTGVYRFKTYHALMLSDLNAVRQVQKVDCHKVILPSWVP